jgi:hypothetical protein
MSVVVVMFGQIIRQTGCRLFSFRDTLQQPSMSRNRRRRIGPCCQR